MSLRSGPLALEPRPDAQRDHGLLQLRTQRPPAGRQLHGLSPVQGAWRFQQGWAQGRELQDRRGVLLHGRVKHANPFWMTTAVRVGHSMHHCPSFRGSTVHFNSCWLSLSCMLSGVLQFSRTDSSRRGPSPSFRLFGKLWIRRSGGISSTSGNKNLCIVLDALHCLRESAITSRLALVFPLVSFGACICGTCLKPPTHWLL